MGTVANHIERVSPSICQITVPGQVGTGFAVQPSGRVITCDHVTGSVTGAGSIRARFPNGQEYSARVHWRDPQLDLAILELSDRPPQELPLTIPPSVRVGDDVFLAGYPAGVRTLSVFKGCISAIGPNLLARGGGELLQVEATVQKGNSGGPLFSAETGDVLGVISMKYVPLFQELDKLKQTTQNWPTPGVQQLPEGGQIRREFNYGNLDFNKYFEFTGRAFNQLASTLELVSIGVGWAIPIGQLDPQPLS